MELIKQYDAVTIIEVIVLLALAVKGVISFFEWLFPRLKGIIKKADEPELIKDDIKHQTQEIDGIKESLQELTRKIDTLIASDKDDIKAFITR